MIDGGAIEFSRPRSAVNLPADGRTFTAVASAEECIALAGRIGVLAVEDVRIEGVLKPRSRSKQVVLTASLTARVTQSCVITLEPVVNVIDTAFERVFEFGIADEWARFGDTSRDVVLGSPEIDAADPIVDDVIDVGEAAAEQLALEVDPFPRVPGAVFDPPAPELGDQDAPGAKNPFAALNSLRKRD